MMTKILQDLVNGDVYAKFGQTMPIRSQGIEPKRNSNVHQRP